MMSIVYHLIQSCCQNDSDAWFSIIDVQEPQDSDFENFLDVADKTEDIQNYLISDDQVSADYHIKELAQMIFAMEKI